MRRGCKGGFFRSLSQQSGPREHRQHVDPARFDGLAAAFLAVHEHEAEGDFSAFALDGVDGFEGGAAGGDDVIDDDHVVAGLEVSLDLFAGTVALGFLADGEHLQRFGRVLGGGSHADCERNRIRAERHAADGIDLEVLRVDLGADCVPGEIADEIGTEGVERGDPAIDVKIALFSGRERE